MTGFLDSHQEQTLPTLHLARRLAAAIRQRTGTSRPINVVRWAEDLCRIKASLEQIDQVVTWYIANAHRDDVPKIRSASGLQTNFKSIQQLMENDIPISDAAKNISKRLAIEWPGQQKEDELRLIQVSLNRYKKWRESLVRAVQQNQGSLVLRGFCRHLLYTLPDADTFVETWVAEASRVYNRQCDTWRGGLQGLAFRSDHPIFALRCEQLSREYAGTVDLWHQTELVAL